jgi:phosphoribosylaminoimidazolecarboxamide formyltransferase/IMP cyclohydrolase
MTDQPIRRALLSVHDKSGLGPLAAALHRRGVEVLSTGGTARALRDLNLNVIEVSAVTGAAEILDGRVKTLHPAIHGGILARRDRDDDLQVLKEAGIGPIDLVVVNLYPFAATLASGASAGDVIEMIDVGGPAMIRAAAKNHVSVVAIIDPEDYEPLLAELEEHGGTTSLDFRRAMAAKAFALTASYDAAIAGWLGDRLGRSMPERLIVAGERRLVTRYGENPHQRGAFYATGAGGLAAARQVQGKELSYNNLADADAALALVREFDPPAVVIVKHANPCGVAVAEDLETAHAGALAADPQSAFGGIVAVNRPLDRATAEAIAAVFTEVVIAPDADAGARKVFAARKNLRLLLVGSGSDDPGPEFRSVAGGFLVQERDRTGWPEIAPRLVTSRAPTADEEADLRLAWLVAKHVKSNAIVFARGGATVGIGAGQMSRLDSVAIAVRKAEEAARDAGEPGSRLEGSVLASDAFFPFADGLEMALAAGARAVIQPGGSVRDEEVIAAAERSGAAMLFTGERHFRH